MYGSSANIPAPIAKVPIETPVKDGFRNNERSSIGRSWRSSASTNSANRTAAATNMLTIVVLVQPSAFARIRPKTSRNIELANVTRPATSRRIVPESLTRPCIAGLLPRIRAD